MRRSVIASVIVHALAATAGVLWLLWYFIPLGNLIKTGVTLLLAVLVILAVLREKKRGTAAQSVADALPEIDTSGPVMLVCGEDSGNLFNAQPLRKTSQGWWLHVGEVSRLAGMVKGIQQRQPHAVGQLAVMFIFLSDLTYPHGRLQRNFLRSARRVHRMRLIPSTVRFSGGSR